MNKRKIYIFSVVILGLLLSGCTKGFSLGYLDDGMFKNDFFNISMEINEDFTVLTQEQILQMQQVEDAVVIENDEELAEQQVVYHLYALKYPVDHIGTNPYIAVYTENMSYLDSGVSSKEDYVSYNMSFAKEMFTLSGFEADYTGIDKLWIDDRQFATSILTTQIEDIKMNKEMFTLVKNDYAICIVIGYDTIEDREELRDYVYSFTIED